MKRILCVIFFMALNSAICSHAESLDPSGKWKIRNMISGNTSEQTCSFHASNEAFSGDCTSENSAVKIAGTINGHEISWSYETRRMFIKLSVLHKGVIDSDKMSGTVVVSPYGAKGTFSAYREK